MQQKTAYAAAAYARTMDSKTTYTNGMHKNGAVHGNFPINRAVFFAFSLLLFF